LISPLQVALKLGWALKDAAKGTNEGQRKQGGLYIAEVIVYCIVLAKFMLTMA